jgi:hypothetical protein
MIDVDTKLSDVQEGSNLLKDIISVSTLNTDKSYYMQPMLRRTPGFRVDTHQLHGSDIIDIGSGFSIVIGDDIRGASPFDLTQQLATVDDLRQDLDNLVVDLSVRLSTVEVYADFVFNAAEEPYQLNTVGCDTITTDPDGQALVIGDS